MFVENYVLLPLLFPAPSHLTTHLLLLAYSKLTPSPSFPPATTWPNSHIPHELITATYCRADEILGRTSRWPNPHAKRLQPASILLTRATHPCERLLLTSSPSRPPYSPPKAKSLSRKPLTASLHPRYIIYLFHTKTADSRTLLSLAKHPAETSPTHAQAHVKSSVFLRRYLLQPFLSHQFRWLKPNNLHHLPSSSLSLPRRTRTSRPPYRRLTHDLPYISSVERSNRTCSSILSMGEHLQHSFSLSHITEAFINAKLHTAISHKTLQNFLFKSALQDFPSLPFVYSSGNHLETPSRSKPKLTPFSIPGEPTASRNKKFLKGE